MKKVTFILSLALVPLFSTAQTAEDIIAKCVEVTGGEENWNKLEGQKMKAKMTTNGMEIGMEMLQMKDGRTATVIRFQGMELKQNVYDGETLWNTNFMNMKPEKADSETFENFKRTLGEYPSPLITYKKMGYEVKLEGDENVDGVEAYKVKMIKKPLLVDGKEEKNITYYFFDKETGVLIMTAQEISSGKMKGKMAKTFFSDYDEVDGLYFPFSMKMGADDAGYQEITIESYELNPQVEDSFFAYPGDDKDEEEKVKEEEPKKKKKKSRK